MVEEICLRILKAISEAVFSVIRFVVEIFVEAVIGVRWILLIGLTLMGLLWFWMQQDPRMRRPKPYHVDSSPDRIMR